MSLVTSRDIASVLKLSKSKFVGKIIGNLFLHVTQISGLNKIYNRHKDKTGHDFLDAILDDFEINYEVSQEDLAKIPKKGSFITVSNHPLGGIDGILLLKILNEQREDYKIIANFLLERIKPLDPYIMPVNPFETRKDSKSSVGGIKAAIAHLRKGCPLGIFPAGEVSTLKEKNRIVDKPWEQSAIRLIKKAKVPVIPVYFEARNSNLFYLLSRLNPTLRTVKLPSEMFKQKKRKITISIGNPISAKEQNRYSDIKEYADLLRRATFIQHKNLENASKGSPTKTPESIAPRLDKKLLIRDIEAFGEDNLVWKSKCYELYFVREEQIPNIIQEIGRVREHVYRDVGEGTQQALDLDAYDKYYRHLFIWDTENHELAGGYRLGLGDEIFEKYGQKGFYVDDFFKFESAKKDFLATSIEMGRAFVHLDYQKKPLPLLLLLKGIYLISRRYPKLNKLVGSVSISDYFSTFSKALMVGFFDYYFKDEAIAKHIKTRKRYQFNFPKDDIEFIFRSTDGNIRKFDRRIVDMEPQIKMGIPMFLKRYIELNARVIGFAVDPDFNQCLDVLMYLNLEELATGGILEVIKKAQ